MEPNFLAAGRLKVQETHGHLLNLLTEEERQILNEEVPAHEHALWQYWEEYVIKTIVLGKSPITIKSVRDAINIIIRHTGLFTIEQVNTPGVLDDALLSLQLRRNQKPSTRNTYIKNLNTYFIWLYKNHKIDQNNITRIERGRESPPDVIPLTEKQIEKVVIYVGSRHYATAVERARNILMIDIFRFTGIRPCELLDMQSDAIFEDEKCWKMVINGRKQKGRLRYYEIPTFIIHAYQYYMSLRETCERFEKPLFISMSSREGWKMSGLQNFFKRTSKDLGFRVTAYGFRRYIASYMSKTGISRDDLSRYLGHTRFSTTDRYIARECYLTKGGTDLMSEMYGGR